MGISVRKVEDFFTQSVQNDSVAAVGSIVPYRQLVDQFLCIDLLHYGPLLLKVVAQTALLNVFCVMPEIVTH
jgi:hypothetical protein